MVKVISQQAASSPHTDGSMVFTRWRQCAPPRNTSFLWPTWLQIPNSISIGSAGSTKQLTAERPYTLQWATLLPPQNCTLPWGPGSPSNTLFLGPIWAHNPNGISIGSAISAWLNAVTDRPLYSVCKKTGRIYIRTMAMRPNNKSTCISPGGSVLVKKVKAFHISQSKIKSQWLTAVKYHTYYTHNNVVALFHGVYHSYKLHILLPSSTYF